MRIKPRNNLEDRLERNILFPFAGYKTLDKWVYGKLLEHGVLSYEAVQKAAQFTATKDGCRLVRDSRDLPKSYFQALALGRLPLEAFLEQLKVGSYSLAYLHEAPQWDLQLGPRDNHISRAIMTAPPIDIEREIRLAGMSEGAKKRLRRRANAALEKFLGISDQGQGDYLLFHKELFPRTYVDDEALENFIQEWDEVCVFYPREVAEEALARGIDPSKVAVEYDGQVKSPFFVVRDGRELVEPEVTKKAGLLIPAEGNSKLGEGGMGEVYRLMNVTGFRIVAPEEESLIDGLEEIVGQRPIALTDRAWVAKKIPNEAMRTVYRNLGLKLWQAEGTHGTKLRHLPHVVRVTLEDNSHIEDHPVPVALYSEQLYDSCDKFIEDAKQRYSSNPKLGSDKEYTPRDAALMAAIDHAYRQLVSFALVNHGHGDIKPENWMTSRRRQHDFRVFVAPSKRPYIAKVNTDLVDEKILDHVYKKAFYDDVFLCVMDLGSVRDQSSGIVGMNAECMYTPDYVDLKWFALGGRTNHYTDMYAAGQAFVNLLRPYIENDLEASKDHPDYEELSQSLLYLKQVYSTRMAGPVMTVPPGGVMNIASSWNRFFKMANEAGVEPPFSTFVDDEGYERLSIPWSPRMQTEFEDSIEKTLIDVQKRQSSWPIVIGSMVEKGLVSIHPDIIKAVGNMITDPYRRECLDPGMPKQRQVIPQLISNFRDYMGY